MEFNDFLHSWHYFLIVLGIFCTILVPIIYSIYYARYLSLDSYKKRYGYILRYRIRVYKVINIIISIILFCLSNLYNYGALGQSLVHFIVLFSVGIVIGVAYLYFVFMYLNVYYGKRLKSSLDKLRYTPRINPKTDNTMRLLSEEEEDVYLDEGMQAEEDIFSVDYDVWIDDENGDVLIERYQGGAIALECQSCGFQTLRLIKEEVVQDESSGKSVLQYYSCSYCKNEVEKVVRAKEGGPGSQASDSSAQGEIESVSLTVNITNQGMEVFDFQTLEQARNFISKFQAQRQIIAANRGNNTQEDASDSDSSS